MALLWLPNHDRRSLFARCGRSAGTSWPTLTRINYGEWSVTMKVKLRAPRLWNAVDKGIDNEEDDMSARCYTSGV